MLRANGYLDLTSRVSLCSSGSFRDDRQLLSLPAVNYKLTRLLVIDWAPAWGKQIELLTADDPWMSSSEFDCAKFLKFGFGILV